MHFLLLVTTFMALASADSVSNEEQEFQDWKRKYGKIYKSAQVESQHKNNWLKNLQLVLKHNKLADQGIKSYRLGMTYFADMDNKEYKEIMFKGCLFFNRTKNHSATTFLRQTGGAPLPDTVDWRKEGYVTEVKEQKDCGSCWAFSATGALEGQTFKKTGKLVSLSEQQLIDCSQKYGNRGCQGGLMNLAFKYVQENEGLDTEVSYPYEAENGVCRYNPATVGATCTGYVEIRSEEKDLQEAVATIGPISVGIDAYLDSLKLYVSGVYDESDCSSHNLNHAVLVVGYGTDNGKDYWLVKNSWGLSWGDKGYIKMSRNKDNQCGIATAASYPVVFNKTQRVQCEACSTIFVLGCLLLGMFY